jgi:hypothetical protein
MNAFKKAILGTVLTSSFLMLALGSYNSATLDKSVFKRNDFGIKLAKRLDEIKGEITIGRMAASLPTWSQTSTKLIKEEVKQILKKEMEPKKVIKVANKETPRNIPAPVVNGDLDLSLSGGFYNKKALDDSAEFSGSANVQDGVIEEINVSLPGGDSLSINTNERMVGNVFQYEDTETREIKSGLFYKVKPGVFMVTLTNDSQYPGLRLEFKTEGNAQIASEETPMNNWKLNTQNKKDENAEQAKNDNDEIQNDYYQDETELNQEAPEQEENSDSQDTVTGFNFSV